MEPNQTCKLFYSKGNHKQDKKTALRRGETICTRSSWQLIGLPLLWCAPLINLFSCSSLYSFLPSPSFYLPFFYHTSKFIILTFFLLLLFLSFHEHLFNSVQSLSCVRLFATPWIAARQASLSITNSRSSLRLTCIESLMPSSHLILCRPLPPAPNPSQHQSLFQWVNSLHEVAKVLEFQL